MGQPPFNRQLSHPSLLSNPHYTKTYSSTRTLSWKTSTAFSLVPGLVCVLSLGELATIFLTEPSGNGPPVCSRYPHCTPPKCPASVISWKLSQQLDAGILFSFHRET